MKKKPAHLTEPWASQWEHAAMAEAYPCRPPYPPETFDILQRLAEDGRMLDVGCGTGDIARPLAARGLDVDALDRSGAMIAVGRSLPDGDAPRWITGRVEDAEVNPPYALVTAGESVHWFDWETAFTRMRELAPRIALIYRDSAPAPWEAELRRTIPRYSTNRTYAAYDLMEELSARGLFLAAGSEQTPWMEFEQSLDDYVASIHSRNGFSRARMDPERAAAFDRAVRRMVDAPVVRLSVRATVRWS